MSKSVQLGSGGRAFQARLPDSNPSAAAQYTLCPLTPMLLCETTQKNNPEENCSNVAAEHSTAL